MECMICAKTIDHKTNFRGRCGQCHAEFLEASARGGSIDDLRELKEQKRKREAKETERLASEAIARHRKSMSNFSNIILTTESSHNLPVKMRLDIVSAEVVVGMNIFKDALAGVRNIVGGRSGTIQTALRDIRVQVLNELKREASDLDADAVVGVDLDYLDVGATGSTMLVAIATGTAVKLATPTPLETGNKRGAE